MPSVIPLIISSAVASITGAVIALLISHLQNATQKQIQRQEAFQEGMKALLWGELKQICTIAQKEKHISTEDKHHLENVYQVYHSLGGNGTGTKLYEKTMELPSLNE